MEKHYTPEENRAYEAALPRKICSAAVLIRDEVRRVLLVKPTYKPHWQIPGGVVDAGEPPRHAAAREIREELGLTLDVGQLLALQHSRRANTTSDILHFVFDGGVVANEMLEKIVLQESEIGEWRMVEVENVGALLADRGLQRCEAALEAVTSGETVYLEAGEERP